MGGEIKSKSDKTLITEIPSENQLKFTQPNQKGNWDDRKYINTYNKCNQQISCGSDIWNQVTQF